MSAPVRGTVWTHPKFKDFSGGLRKLTVTSVSKATATTPQLVYSRDPYNSKRLKVTLESFEAHAKIVSVPDTKPKATGPALTDAECRDLYNRACDAGKAAGQAAIPTPMHVVSRVNPLDDNSPVATDYGVYSEGSCGFGWVTVHPGNSRFARWLTKQGIASKAYGGGVQVWVREFGQSVDRKAAYAGAFAAVLSDAGITAYGHSRMD